MDNTSEQSTEVAQRPTVTIFMPTLNEIDGVRSLIPRIKREWCDELIVIDGGSTDGTVEYLREQGIDVRPEERRGVVNAYNQAFRATRSDIFIAIQSDGNCLVELIPDLIREARKGYDIVFVSRYLPPAKSYDDGAITAIGNYAFTRLINLLFRARYTDVLGGFRAYRRDAVLKMGLDVQPNENWLTARYDLLNTWELGGCVRAAKLKLHVHEMPGDEPARIGGKSKVSTIRNGLLAFAQITYEVVMGKSFIARSPRLRAQYSSGVRNGLSGAADKPVGVGSAGAKYGA